MASLSIVQSFRFWNVGSRATTEELQEFIHSCSLLTVQCKFVSQKFRCKSIQKFAIYRLSWLASFFEVDKHTFHQNRNLFKIVICRSFLHLRSYMCLLWWEILFKPRCYAPRMIRSSTSTAMSSVSNDCRWYFHNVSGNITGGFSKKCKEVVKFLKTCKEGKVLGGSICFPNSSMRLSMSSFSW